MRVLVVVKWVRIFIDFIVLYARVCFVFIFKFLREDDVSVVELLCEMMSELYCVIFFGLCYEDIMRLMLLI